MQVAKKYLKGIVEQTKARMLSTATHYGLPEEDIPDRYYQQLSEVLKATDYEDARLIANKVWDKFFICVLSMWAKKEIPGPKTPESLEKRAKQAESLARMLENKGDDVAAKKQFKKAEAFRKEAAAMGRGP